MDSSISKKHKTPATTARHYSPQKINLKHKQHINKKSAKQIYPLKFPKRLIRKPTQQTMLTQSNPNPEIPCLRISEYANRSRIFEGNPLPLRESQIMARQTTHHFYKQIKLALPGNFCHLGRQSAMFPIPMKIYAKDNKFNNQHRTEPSKQIGYESTQKGQLRNKLNQTLNMHQNLINTNSVSSANCYNKYRQPNKQLTTGEISKTVGLDQTSICKHNKL